MKSWTQNEPGFLRLGEELRRLYKRASARDRWLRALLIATLMSAAVVGMMYRKPQKYFASLTLSVTEGVVQDRTGPVPKNQLRTYISDVSLNRRHVTKLIESFDLYPTLRRIDPQLAIDEFWSDLEVDVYQNQFAVEADQANTRRSARVQIMYAANDPDTAVLVTNEIRRLITEFEVRRARLAAEEGFAELSDAVAAAEEIIDQHKIELAKRSDELLVAPPQREGALKFEVSRLEERMLNDVRRLDQMQKAKAALDVRRQLQNAQSGQLISVVDQQVPAPHNPKPIRLAIVGLAVFLLGFPMAAMGVAAFDHRIYDANDIRRLGVRVVGHVAPRSADERALL
jgi:hypothetical protein